MPRAWTILLTLLLGLWSGVAKATTGGDEPLQVLGVAEGDGKLYLLREIDDGSEALPELSYVLLEGPSAGRVVPVRSFYRELDDPDADYEVVSERFHTKLERLKARLKPAKTIAPVCAAKATAVKTFPVDDPWVPEWDTEYLLEIAVTPPGAPRDARTATVTAYSTDVEVVAEVRVPGVPLAIVLVRFFSDAYEHGYHSDVAVAVPLTPRAVEDGERASAVVYHPYGNPDPVDE